MTPPIRIQRSRANDDAIIAALLGVVIIRGVSILPPVKLLELTNR